MQWAAAEDNTAGLSIHSAHDDIRIVLGCPLLHIRTMKMY